MAESKKEKSSTPSSCEETYPDDKIAAISSSPFQPDGDIGAHFGVNEKALVRKLDRKLLPAVTVLYLLSFLDRSNGISTSTSI